MNRPTSDRPTSGKSKKLSASSFDDLPEALREGDRPIVRSKRPPRWMVVGMIVGFLGVIFLIRAVVMNSGSTTIATPNPPTPSPSTGQVFGHYTYAEAPAGELEPVSADGSIRLRKAAAEAYNAMVAAAQADGVRLSPLSGFRSIQDQEHVFFDVKEERSQTASDRANVSAPPGHSEHHTGYAIDIGDGDAPDTNLNPDFDHTAAFKWLSVHATQHNFEMSFPKENSQGIAYEPWHWRFVGDRASLETFFRARGK